MAAVCKFALENYEEPIRRDHSVAAEWANQLSDIGLKIVQPQTNIVLVDLETSEKAENFVENLAKKEIYLQQAAETNFVRAVFHRSADYSKIEYSIETMRKLQYR